VSLPATRAEAKALGSTEYFTGAPCKHGHVTSRYTANGTCTQCQIDIQTWRYPSEYHKDKRLQRSYGITLAQFRDVLAAQDYHCPICREPFDQEGGRGSYAPCVDHCHETGVFRAILCNACNRSIGLMRHRPDVLHAAGDYLEKHNGNL